MILFLILILIIFVSILPFFKDFLVTNINNYNNYCHQLEYIVYAFINKKKGVIRFPFHLYNEKNKSLLKYYEKNHNIKIKKEYWLLNNYYRNNDFSSPLSFNKFFLKRKERFIYLSRGNSKRRKIINEEYLINFLKNKIKNIEIVKFDKKTTFLEQAEIFSNCKLFITLHGAGLANMYYMPENSHVIELTPKNSYNHNFNNIAKKLKINHYYLDIKNHQKSKEVYRYPRDSFLTINKKEMSQLENYIDKII